MLTLTVVVGLRSVGGAFPHPGAPQSGYGPSAASATSAAGL